MTLNVKEWSKDFRKLADDLTNENYHTESVLLSDLADALDKHDGDFEKTLERVLKNVKFDF